MTSRVGRGGRWPAGCPCSTVLHLCLGQSSQDPWGFQSRPALSLGWGLPIGGGLRQDKAPASSLSSGGPRPVQDPLGLRGLTCLPCVASRWGWDRENGRKWAPT